MLNLDKTGIDKLLLQLEDGGFIDSRYGLYKKDNEPNLLGWGGFSYVYEMFDRTAPERHYAAKIIGAGEKGIDEQLIIDTTGIQYSLGLESENITRIIALWIMKLHLDDEGNVVSAIMSTQKNYDEDNGPCIGIVLMEKLDDVIVKDKYGNVELACEELRTEEGVIRFAKDIGRALFTAHNGGFLHRDIKLENIFWDKNRQQYKLSDFGTARYVGAGDAETVVFTDGYGAPEIECRLRESYNLTADIYSFGITIYLLLNNLKFPASDGYRANIIQYSKDFVVPAPVNASEAMARIIRKMCSYHVQDRYQSVEEVLMDIGLIDGSYGENGFTEYDNSETEIYTDPDKETTGSPETKPSAQGEEDKLTREAQKKGEKTERETYGEYSMIHLVVTAILTFMLLKSFSPETDYLMRWEFWILPLVMGAASILQRIKEFHVEGTLLTVGAAGLSIYYLGADVPQIMTIIAVLMGIPSLTAGVALGMGLWLVQVLTGSLSWLEVLNRWDLGWIIIIAFYAELGNNIRLRIIFDKSGRVEEFVLFYIMDKFRYLTIIAGVILWLLELLDVITIPDVVEQLHLIRIGIGFLIVWAIHARRYFISDEEKEEINESVDK